MQKRRTMYCSLGLMISLLFPAISCGGGTSSTQLSSSLSGNWEIQLFRHVLPNPPLVYSGFLIQSGDSITGSVMFNLASIGSGRCEGTGTISGTLNQQNVTLTIDELGESVSLDGTLPTSNTGSATPSPLSGEFSNVAGGCTNWANSGTWTATSIAPIAGSFHGAFTSTLVPSQGTINVTGTLNQGSNTGASSATLSGSIAPTGTQGFCPYIVSANLTGLVSGTSVALNLYASNGGQAVQLGQLGSNSTVTISPDAKTLSGTYAFPSLSSTCTGDQGTFQLTFP